MGSNKENELMKQGCVGVACCIISVLTPVLIIAFVNDIYEYHTCTITNITYPAISYTNDTIHWSHCKCGKRCVSYAPIINLYGYIENITDKPLIIKNTINVEHTFFNKYCITDNKNKTQIINNKLEYARNIYNKYKNTTIGCYYADNELFLHIYEFPNELLILIISVISIMCCCCWGCLFSM